MKGCFLSLAVLIFGFFAVLAIARSENAAETEKLANMPLYENVEYVQVAAGDLIKQRLKDPDSYKFVDMQEQPSTKQGEKLFVVTYRDKNGFGGYNVGEALFSCDKDNLTLLSIKGR